jgi:hypothetical protein
LFFSRAKLKAFTSIYADTIRSYFIAFGVEFSCLQEAGDSREKYPGPEPVTGVIRRAWLVVDCAHRAARGYSGQYETGDGPERAGCDFRLSSLCQ